jgi:hypothetical protein
LELRIFSLVLAEINHGIAAAADVSYATAPAASRAITSRDEIVRELATDLKIRARAFAS